MVYIDTLIMVFPVGNFDKYIDSTDTELYDCFINNLRNLQTSLLLTGPFPAFL